MAGHEREWTIGHLARVAGVSVRALRHYDHLGLLVPSERSGGGHRRYGIGDVERLYRIVALRSLGVGLDAIAAVLDDDEPAALLETVRRQLEHVDRELEAGRQVRARLIRVIAVLERAERPSSGQLIDLLEGMALTVNLTRIYTKLGDGAETHLGDLSRVPKTHPRIEAYGAVDELNATSAWRSRPARSRPATRSGCGGSRTTSSTWARISPSRRAMDPRTGCA
jgi:DNA-binding transcriptional MerR regulator